LKSVSMSMSVSVSVSVSVRACVCTCVCARTLFRYGVATVSRIDKIISLFCKRDL